MVGTTILVEAQGELVTFTEEGIATYRFERPLPNPPLVVMVHLAQDTVISGMSKLEGVKLSLSLELPQSGIEKFNSAHVSR